MNTKVFQLKKADVVCRGLEMYSGDFREGGFYNDEDSDKQMYRRHRDFAIPERGTRVACELKRQLRCTGRYGVSKYARECRTNPTSCRQCREHVVPFSPVPQCSIQYRSMVNAVLSGIIRVIIS
jgi:hypothetical protein